MHVDRVLAGERRCVGIGIIDGSAGDNAGVVDEDVEPPKVLCYVIDELFDLARRCLVGLVGAGIYALGLQIADRGFSLVGRGDIADGDVSAFIRQRAGAGCADAGVSRR
jgi:hypothetical protein